MIYWFIITGNFDKNLPLAKFIIQIRYVFRFNLFVINLVSFSFSQFLKIEDVRTRIIDKGQGTKRFK